MKRVLLLMAIILGGAIAVLRLLPAERRKGLSPLPAAMMGRMMEACMEHMPDESPPKAIMSGLRRIQEQNEQLLALLRERLPVEESSSVESPSSRASRSKTKETGDVSSD